jgi:hypothetical protein
MAGNTFSSSRCYANCVSTALTVLITLKVSISFIVTLYLHCLSCFPLEPTDRCVRSAAVGLEYGMQKVVCDLEGQIYKYLCNLVNITM